MPYISFCFSSVPQFSWSQMLNCWFETYLLLILIHKDKVYSKASMVQSLERLFCTIIIIIGFNWDGHGNVRWQLRLWWTTACLTATKIMTNNLKIEPDNECDNQPNNRRIGSTPQLSMKAGTTNIARYCMLQAIATNNCNNQLEKRHIHTQSSCWWLRLYFGVRVTIPALTTREQIPYRSRVHWVWASTISQIWGHCSFSFCIFAASEIK